MYKLTTALKELLAPYEGPNWLKIFDTSKEWFVLWFGMTKIVAIERGIIEKQVDNPLYQLCIKNEYIPHQWISKHLSEEDYDEFLKWMNWQGQSEYWVFSTDVVRFLKINLL